jgi:hypothetical protein
MAVILLAFCAASARADEGGVSFWLPGQYASFAAVAPTPGWSLPFEFYNYGGSAGADILLPRGHLMSVGLTASIDALFITPTYTPDATFLGARPSFSVAFAPSYTGTSAAIGLGPQSSFRTDARVGGSDLYPTAQLFWQLGPTNNVMIYVTGDVPVGSYDPNRLANVGIGHGAVDEGGSYTYLNTTIGTEFSATLGFTQNFRNVSTDYTNGADAHLDLGASKFLTKNMFVGVVGYYYQQLTADQGQIASLGPNESRTRGAGPQIGYNFTVGDMPISANLRGYTEFGSFRRLTGHAIYASVDIPLGGLARH